jgi:UDP-N-acetylglucosamine--N-acetylmuramyl-(pentapeptide) pyrophosphoryl-undecaprenol N-acetylglucosamine transferase
MAKRIIISGGGTGGHIFPAIAIANALKKLDPATEILFVGAVMAVWKWKKYPRQVIKYGPEYQGIQRGSLLEKPDVPG